MPLISGFFPPGFSSGSPSGRRHAAPGTASLAKLDVAKARIDVIAQKSRCFTLSPDQKFVPLPIPETFQPQRIAIKRERGNSLFLRYRGEDLQVTLCSTTVHPSKG